MKSIETKKLIKILILFLTILFETNIYSKILIWDLGYTLVKPNKMCIAKKIGLSNSIEMYSKFGKASNDILSDTLFALLKEKNEKQDKSYSPHDPTGKKPLPKKYCDWLKGKCSCNDIKKLALKKCSSYEDFLWKGHLPLIKNAINVIFDAKALSQCMRPINGIIKIVEECAQVKDKDGKPAHSLYILSNWDSESFKYFYENPKNNRIFKYFKPGNIFISGLLNDLKPNPSIFKKLLEKCKLDPKECIFLDDQKENLKTAEELGMTVILVKKNNFKEIHEKLENLDVLPKTQRPKT
jgi:FMN phosphatase YigB (HAD superfamily)